MLRLSPDAPSVPPLWWTAAGWQAVGELRPKPLWPAVRGFRHSDPDCFWGPAVHYNRTLEAYVMLLNHTAGGDGDLLQEGVYASMNPAIDDPAGWTPPLQIVCGGAWYPQAVGLAGRRATNRPLTCTKQGFADLFGADRRCPW